MPKFQKSGGKPKLPSQISPKPQRHKINSACCAGGGGAGQRPRGDVPGGLDRDLKLLLRTRGRPAGRPPRRAFSSALLALAKGRLHGEFLSFSDQGPGLGPSPTWPSDKVRALGGSRCFPVPWDHGHRDSLASGSHAAPALVRWQWTHPSLLPPPPTPVATQEFKTGGEGGSFLEGMLHHFQ